MIMYKLQFNKNLNESHKNIDCHQFLINDIEPVGNRILEFATKKKLDLMVNSDH